jgi:hypothetical protein
LNDSVSDEWTVAFFTSTNFMPFRYILTLILATTIFPIVYLVQHGSGPIDPVWEIICCRVHYQALALMGYPSKHCTPLLPSLCMPNLIVKQIPARR